MIASLSIAETALSASAGFLLAMLAARTAQRRLYRSLRRAHWTLRTLPEWCAFALYVDAQARALRVRSVYARLIEEGAR